MPTIGTYRPATIWPTSAARTADSAFDASKSWLLGSQRSLAMIVALAATALLAAADLGA